jgi:putative FmdB family regulatory protein
MPRFDYKCNVCGTTTSLTTTAEKYDRDNLADTTCSQCIGGQLKRHYTAFTFSVQP